MNTESTERNRRRRTSSPARRFISGGAAGVGWLLSRARIQHLRLFFPGVDLLSVGGLVLAMGARAVIARTAIAEHLAAPVLFYLGMATFFACMLWLLFYS